MILAAACIAIVNWRTDPLQHYRPAGYAPLLVEQSRFRNPGLARHCTAPVVIAGTSVSAYIEERDVAAMFEADTLNLGMDGASAHEQHLLLRLALRTGRVRRVIWDANFEYLRGNPEWVSDYDGAFPAYLYDDSPWNDLHTYLLGIDTCKNTARILAGRYPRRKPSDFHKLDPSRRFGTTAIARQMERRLANPGAFRRLIPEFTGDQLVASFRHNHLALIREFPGVHFDLWLPPFASPYFDFLRAVAPELIPEFLAFRRAIRAELSGLPNVTLHDIQADTAIVTGLDHFSDPIHFDRETSIRILEMIRNRTRPCTPGSLEAFEAWLNVAQAASLRERPPQAIR